MLSKLSFQERKGYPVLMYGGKPLARFNRKTLRVVLKDIGFPPEANLSSPPIACAKKVKKNVDDVAELQIMASQLAKAYAKAKKSFYHSKHEAKEIEPGDKDFKHLIEAAKMIKLHGVTNKKFLKAQIAGLKFANNNRGIFPKPSQICTEQAETRLLEYKHHGVTNSDDEIVQVNISVEDRKTPLSENTVYQGRLYKVRDGVAKLKEAVYVRELQLARRGKVNTEVEDYIAKVIEREARE